MAKIKVGEIAMANLPPNFKSSLQPYISQGEEVLLCCQYSLAWAFLDRLLDNHSNEGGAYMITKRHALLVRGIYYKSSPTISVNQVTLEHIASIAETEMTYGLMRGSYVIRLYGQDTSQPQVGFSFPAKNDVYQKFLGVLNMAVEKAKNSGNKEELNIADRLQRLTKLHHDGLITEEEFRRKREEILNQL